MIPIKNLKPKTSHSVPAVTEDKRSNEIVGPTGSVAVVRVSEPQKDAADEKEVGE